MVLWPQLYSIWCKMAWEVEWGSTIRKHMCYTSKHVLKVPCLSFWLIFHLNLINTEVSYPRNAYYHFINLQHLLGTSLNSSFLSVWIDIWLMWHNNYLGQQRMPMEIGSHSDKLLSTSSKKKKKLSTSKMKNYIICLDLLFMWEEGIHIYCTI